LGWKDYSDVLRLYDRAKVGALLLHPAPNHRDAMPTKIFEYLGAGLPVIASSLPQFNGLLHGCGVQVDPLDIEKVRDAIHKLLTDDFMLEQMSRIGRERVLASFCWETEAQRLLEFCCEIFSQ
jgi:glycosyltransferase involved in cell wall biosynthesis